MNNEDQLLASWSEEYVRFPSKVSQYEFDGKHSYVWCLLYVFENVHSFYDVCSAILQQQEAAESTDIKIIWSLSNPYLCFDPNNHKILETHNANRSEQKSLASAICGAIYIFCASPDDIIPHSWLDSRVNNSYLCEV